MLQINTELWSQALSRVSKYDSSHLNASKQHLPKNFILVNIVVTIYLFYLHVRKKNKIFRKFSRDIKGDWERFTPKTSIQALRTVTFKVPGSATCCSSKKDLNLGLLTCPDHRDSVLDLKKNLHYETFIEKIYISVKNFVFTKSTFSDEKWSVKIILTISSRKRQDDNLLWHYLRYLLFASHLALESP